MSEQPTAPVTTQETRVITWDDADPEAKRLDEENYEGRHRKPGLFKRAGAGAKEVGSTFVEAGKYGKRLIGDAIRTTHAAWTTKSKDIKIEITDGMTREDVKEARKKEEKRLRKARIISGISATATLGGVAWYVGMQYAPAFSSGARAFFHGLGGGETDTGGLDHQTSNGDNYNTDGMSEQDKAWLAHYQHVEHEAHETHKRNVDARAETIGYDAELDDKYKARDVAHAAEVEAANYGPFRDIDYLFDGKGRNKETRFAMGPAGDIYNEAGKLDAHEVLRDFDTRYGQDPALVATHMAGFGLIDMKDVDTYTAKFAGDHDAWKQAVQDLYNKQASMKMRFEKIDYQYDSMYFADKNGDGVPELYHADDLDHGGMSVVFTDKSGKEVILRADCGWQVISKDRIPNVPHINQPPVTPPVEHPHTPVHRDTPPTRTPVEEITRVPRERATPPPVVDIPDKPDAPEVPEAPVTSKTPDIPVVPEKPTAPETPKTTPVELTPKDESKSASNNPHVGTIGDKPVGSGKLTTEPASAPRVYRPEPQPIATQAPDAEPVTSIQRDIPAPETDANKPLTETQQRQNAGTPEGGVGNTETVAK